MKGVTVRQLKSNMSWVKYAVRQYGFYLLKEIRVNKNMPLDTKGIEYVNLWYICYGNKLTFFYYNMLKIF